MQNKVKEFNELKNTHYAQMPAYARLLDIQSELGELSKEYLKNSKYGTEEFVLTDDFKFEFGDTLYSLLSLADELNIDSSECLDLVLEKYKQRINQNGSMGSKKE